MERDALRACPVCTGRTVNPLHRQRFVLPEGHPLSQGYEVVDCVSCGFVYADVAASQKDYDAFYAKLSKYEDPEVSTGSGETGLDRERFEGTADILSAYVSSQDRILDIGCAGGGLLAAMQRRGYPNLAGLDPSEGCVRRARQKIADVQQGWLSNLPRGIGTFDCVTLSHVMEHVLDVPPAIENLRTVLNPGARIYIEVPDAGRYADHVHAPFQDFNTEHINHFSLRCLDNLMARHGYERTGAGERLLKPSSHTFTPAIYGVYRQTQTPPAVEPDRKLKAAIEDYIERSAKMLKALDDFLREELRRTPELIVWGTGQLALELLSETCLSEARLAAFADSNPIQQGRRLLGIPILPPGDLHEFSQPILVATLLHQREIAEQARGMGLKNRLILLPEL